MMLANGGYIMTKKQKKDYIKSGYNKCPGCGSTDICGGSVEVDGNIAIQNVSCNECDKIWNDIYTLSDVEIA
jgi:transcription elongation factor Elf1